MQEVNLTSDEREFDYAFKFKGGIRKDFEVPVVLKGAQNAIDVLRKLKPILPEANINIVNDSTFGACATKVDMKYFIGINYGTYMLLFALFCRMLGNKDILSSIGNSSNEIDQEKLFNIHILDINLLAAITEPVIPVDSTRKALAFWLANKALHTITIHEYAHIINGHCDLMLNINSNGIITENLRHNSIVSSEDMMLSQTLEFDADAYSTLKGLTLLNMEWNQKAFVDELNSVFKSFTDMLSMWSFANYSIWKLFGVGNYDLDRLSTYSHPPPSIRQRLALDLISTIHLDSNKCDEVVSACLNAALEADRSFEKLSQTVETLEGWKMNQDPRCEEHMESLRGNWKNVRPLLVTYSINGLAPIQE
ncbi:hypothetical protein [Pedobacter alluvionis]|uniref:Uncharacterized protein n=1 Tax=Pedobacter alluvionis TaxID=475253 RepID=A0A497YAB7_9SPHI|nr:hypothetical protein [Pedobacter alluvionis]RLJ80503.1 hypothetical protein BCL90_1283 [Pedobacter alluvionis]TFB31773.1 hypothetical protein E3V97_14430 [Pedobacter alluvionis]